MLSYSIQKKSGSFSLFQKQTSKLIMYINQEIILKAIDNLSKVQPKAKKNNTDILPIFLIFKKIGGSEVNFLNKNQFNKNKQSIINSLFQIGGLFDPNQEKPGKKCCMFFTSFYKEKKFYNPGSMFYKELTSRVTDTIDNTIADYIFEVKNTEDGKYHRLKPNYIDSINKVYDRKIPLYNLLIWIFRFYKIENNTTFYDLKNKFMKEYNLSYDELSNLFDISDNTNIKLEKSNNPVDSQNIREKLQVVDEVELLDDIEVENKTFLKESSLELKSEVNNNIIEHKPENMKQEEFFNLLEKHKQIILTGVPGTGKSYTANEISKKYSKIKKIQFHENYTYQDFIIGKTIRNGSVYYEKGDLIKFLEEIQNEQGIFLLILDEINRGNISSIFGELIYALDRDYNDIKIPLEENSIELKLPDNLHILGTMNSADRSIAVVDFAIRRRFLFVELEPDYNNLDELAKVDGKEILGSFLSKVNKNIENIFESKDYCLGHSFFLTQQIDNNYIYEILKYKIYPTIIEYAHGDRKVLENIFSRELLEAEPSNIIEKIEEFINND